MNPISLDLAAIETAKSVMRAQMRQARRAFIREHPEADWEAGDRGADLVAWLGFTRPGVCAIYHASGSEMDARPLAEDLVKLGWSLALPWCEAPDTAVVFRAWRPGDRMAPDAAGISAPLARAVEVEPDLIICPVLAFDWAGGRLGQGGGYYDRTLARLRAQAKRPVVVGLAFSVQQVEAVPRLAHDQKLDAILTEKGYRRLA
jgi:5-formyltetrahydrofolate cyclo-ligase